MTEKMKELSIDIPDLPDKEITDYTRSMLRRVFVISIFGLVILFGEIGQHIGVSTLITGIKVQSNFVVIFIILINTYYSSLAIAGHQKGLSNYNKQIDKINEGLGNLKHNIGVLEEDYKFISQKINEEGFDKVDLLATDIKSSLLKQLRSKVQKYLFTSLFIQKMEYLVPMLLSLYVTLRLLSKLFDNSIITSTGKAIVSGGAL